MFMQWLWPMLVRWLVVVCNDQFAEECFLGGSEAIDAEGLDSDELKRNSSELGQAASVVWSSANLKSIRGSIRHPFAIGYIYSGWCFVGALWLNFCSQKSFWWDIIRCTNCKAACIYLHPKTVCSRHFHNTKNTVLQATKGCNIWVIWVFPKIGVPPNHPFLLGFSIINHPFWGTAIFGNTHIVIVFESLRSGEQRADTIGGSRQYPWCWNHQVGKQPLHPWRLELCSSQLLCQGAPDEDTNKS